MPTIEQIKAVFEIAQEETADITWGYGIFMVDEFVVLEFAYPHLDSRKHNFLSEEAIDEFFIHKYIIFLNGQVTKEDEDHIPKTEYKTRTKGYEDVVRLVEPEDIKRCIFCDKEDMRKNFWSSRFCSEEHDKLQRAKWKEERKRFLGRSSDLESYEVDIDLD